MRINQRPLFPLRAPSRDASGPGPVKSHLLAGGASGSLACSVPGKFLAGGVVDIGQRQYQQDGLLLAGGAQLIAVADGLGGSLAGGLASQKVLGTLAREADKQSTFNLRRAIAESEHQLKLAIEANEIPSAKGSDETPTGTTIICALRDPATNILTIGHLGDSRGYLFRDGQLQILTLDDVWEMESFIQCDHMFNPELKKLGANADAVIELYRRMVPPLTPDQSRAFSRLVVEHSLHGMFGSKISKYIGVRDSLDERPTINQFQLRPNDLIILTSDGAHNALSHDSLAGEIDLHKTEDPLAIARAVRLALDISDGHDNNTVAVARYL